MSEQAPPPSAIAALEAEGELVDHGGFTLDVAAARTKLADFSLADRHAYVLLLVEVAELLDACTEIRFIVNNSTTRVLVHGLELETAEFEGLFDAVFASRSAATSRLEARRRLAIACHSAAGIEGRRVELTSAGRTLELQAEDTLERPASDDHERPSKTLELLARDTRVGAMLTTKGPEHERAILRERACFATTPVYLDGERINLGFELHGHIGLRSLTDHVDGEGPSEARGLIGWDCLDRRRGLYLVANGVIIERPRRSVWNTCVVAIVDASALERDLSLARFVHDENFDRLVATADAAYEAFDLDALALPKLAGPLPVNKGDDAQRGVAPVLIGVVMLVVGMIGLTDSQPEQPVHLLVMFIMAGLGVLFVGRGMKHLADNSDDVVHETQLGAAAVARLESKAVIRELNRSIAAVRFRVTVFSADRQPHDDTLDARIDVGRVEGFEPGDWVWVHHPAQGGKLIFDRTITSDRPARAIARAKKTTKPRPE